MGNFSDIAPQVHANVMATTQRAVQYLQQTAAQPSPSGPMAPTWAPSAGEKHALSQAVEVVQNPLTVLEHAAAGSLTKEHMKALQAVYPQLAQAITDKALMQAADAKDVPYRQRLMLSILTGVDVDGSLKATTQNQQTIHAVSSKPSMAGTPGGMAPKSSAKGTQKISLASRTAMPGNRPEGEK
jgi:hypothetical protein